MKFFEINIRSVDLLAYFFFVLNANWVMSMENDQKKLQPALVIKTQYKKTTPTQTELSQTELTENLFKKIETAVDNEPVNITWDAFSFEIKNEIIFKVELEGANFFIIDKDFDFNEEHIFSCQGSNLIILGNLTSKAPMTICANELYVIGNLSKPSVTICKRLFVVDGEKKDQPSGHSANIIFPYEGGKEGFIELVRQAIKQGETEKIAKAILDLVLKQRRIAAEII